MGTLFQLSATLLLVLQLGVAQEAAVPDNTTGIPTYKTTVEGCLDGAAGNYTLTGYNGSSYQLAGDAEQLKSHVGETVQIVGVVTPIAHVPLAMSEGTQTQPTLTVSSLKPVSGVCKDNNSLP